MKKGKIYRQHLLRGHFANSPARALGKELVRVCQKDMTDTVMFKALKQMHKHPEICEICKEKPCHFALKLKGIKLALKLKGIKHNRALPQTGEGGRERWGFRFTGV